MSYFDCDYMSSDYFGSGFFSHFAVSLGLIKVAHAITTTIDIIISNRNIISIIAALVAALNLDDVGDENG